MLYTKKFLSIENTETVWHCNISISWEVKWWMQMNKRDQHLHYSARMDNITWTALINLELDPEAQNTKQSLSSPMLESNQSFLNISKAHTESTVTLIDSCMQSNQIVCINLQSMNPQCGHKNITYSSTNYRPTWVELALNTNYQEGGLLWMMNLNWLATQITAPEACITLLKVTPENYLNRTQIISRIGAKMAIQQPQHSKST